MTIELEVGGILIDHDTGGTDAMLVRDECGDPVDGAQIVIYKASEYDAGTFFEYGSTFTGSDGRWLAPIVIDEGEEGLTYLARVYRAGQHRRDSGGRIYHLPPFGPEDYRFTVEDCDGMRSYGGHYLSTGAGATSFTGTTPKLIPGTTTSLQQDNFTHAATGKQTYNGTPTRVFKVSATVAFSLATTAEECTLSLYKNGSLVTGVEMSHQVAAINQTEEVSINALVSLATDDYLEVFLTTATSQNVTVKKYLFSVTT